MYYILEELKTQIDYYDYANMEDEEDDPDDLEVKDDDKTDSEE